MAGTEGGALPFWSPDSRSIGFFADQKLKRIDIAGGPVQTLADAPNRAAARGTTRDNSVCPVQHRPRFTACRPEAAARRKSRVVEAPRQTGHRFPRFLPDGRHFLFFALGAPEGQGVYVGSLDSMDARRLFHADGAARFAPPDYVLFPRQGALWAHRLDLKTLEPVGDPLPVARRVAVDPNLSANVALVRVGCWPVGVPSRRSAASIELVRPVGPADRHAWAGRTMRITRRRPAFSGRAQRRVPPQVNGNTDVWLIEIARGVLRPFTSDPAREYEATWSPDGSRIDFRRTEKAFSTYTKSQSPVPGPRHCCSNPPSTRTSTTGLWTAASSCSGLRARRRRGTSGLCHSSGIVSRLWSRRRCLRKLNGRFSPDGRWIAYETNESGRNEIYVQPFPGPGAKGADLDRRRRLPAVAPRRARDFLPRAGQPSDGRTGQLT